MTVQGFSGCTSASESPAQIGAPAQRLAIDLGLGILADSHPCHGYANGDVCERCTRRASRFAVLRARGFSRSEAAMEAKRFAAGVRTDAELARG